MNTSKRIYLIDYIKALCIIMVIFTHYDWKDKTGLFFTLVIAMAVPVFMVLSGFNFSMSYTKKTDGSLRELYAPRELLVRIWRFLRPFLPIYVLEMILHPMIRGEYYSPADWIYYFFRGGLGPGSYYVPVLIVALLTFPLVYVCVARFRYLGVFFVGLANLFYEILVRLIPISNDLYRLLFFRYLLYTAFGCYYFFHLKDRERYPIHKWLLTLFFFLGLSFSVAVYQFHVTPVIFRYWTKTAMPLAFYIFPILCLCMTLWGDKKIPGLIGEILSKIGQASYHIFLIQMVYYRLFDDLIFPPKPVLPVVCGNIILCLIIGYGYYLLETTVSKHVFSFRR